MIHMAVNRKGPNSADKNHRQPSMSGDIFICLPNVRDHRWLPVARPMPGEERTQAWGVTRVAIRWIALFGLFSFLSDNASAGGDVP
jgi:hypothetical protein